MPLESQKTEAITLPANCCVFTRFGAFPPGPTHCFAFFFNSDVQRWNHVSLMVTNWRKKTLGLRLKRAKQLFESRNRWRFWSIVSKRGTHFAVSFLMPRSTCKISTTDPIDMPAASINLCTFTFGSSNTMTWIFFYEFWSGDVFWPFLSFSIICDRTTSFKFTNRLLNHLLRWRRFPITFIKLLFCLHGVFSN